MKEKQVAAWRCYGSAIHRSGLDPIVFCVSDALAEHIIDPQSHYRLQITDY